MNFRKNSGGIDVFLVTQLEDKEIHQKIRNVQL